MSLLTWWLCAGPGASGSLFAQPASLSAFSYQGRLLQEGNPAEGAVDLSFQLFPHETGESAGSAVILRPEIGVIDGLFTVALDFGVDPFVGAGGWLEIGVRPAGSQGDFVRLTPRQRLMAAPYAIYTLKAESLVGPVPDAHLSTNIARLDADQRFSGRVEFTGPVDFGAGLNVGGAVQAVSFSGSGAGLSNITATTLSARLVERLWKVRIPWVTVTNAGNPADFTGEGAVAYDFRIGRHEVNNNQYVVFLNAVAADDSHNLFDTNMAYSAHGGIERTGQSSDYSYRVKPGRGHQPVVWVDFHDALRFCNWLHNGQPTGPQDASTTEDGAYTLTPGTMLANTVARNPAARFWLPSDDEWYKAAYHHPAEAGGPASGYWLYPTQSNDPPYSEPPPGIVNAANVCCETGRAATDVGAYASSPGFYGTFDQAGNVQEWTEGIVFVLNRRIRGGSWNYNEFYASATDLEFDTTDYPADGIGFRVAGAP